MAPMVPPGSATELWGLGLILDTLRQKEITSDIKEGANAIIDVAF